MHEKHGCIKDPKICYIFRYGTGNYKFGVTSDLRNRLSQHRYAFGITHKPRVIFKGFVMNGQRWEKTMRDVYKANNYKTEWYRFTDEEIKGVLSALTTFSTGESSIRWGGYYRGTDIEHDNDLREEDINYEIFFSKLKP